MVSKNVLIPVPHYASSAMDGYAVAGPQPWTVVFPEPVETDPRKMLTIPPKELYRPVLNLEPGEATRIVTGGLVPAGARAVLRDEFAHVLALCGGELSRDMVVARC